VHRNTPLHVLVEKSGDLNIIKMMRDHLKDPADLARAAIAKNRNGNTVRHLACAKNSIPLQEQKMLVELLVSFGGYIHDKNQQGQVPSFLVAPSRKEVNYLFFGIKI